jgi:hypothetical protein
MAAVRRHGSAGAPFVTCSHQEHGVSHSRTACEPGPIDNVLAAGIIPLTSGDACPSAERTATFVNTPGGDMSQRQSPARNR